MKRITKKRKTQAVVEYFLAFALIIILTVLGFNGAIKTVKDKSKDFFVRKVNDMEPDGSPGGGGEGPPDYGGVPDVDDSDVESLPSGHIGYYYVGPGQARYFKFVAGVPDLPYPYYQAIQVGNTPAGTDQPRTVHLLIKRGSKPTIADFERTWEMPPSDYDHTEEQWIPRKPDWAENLYWKYNTGSQAEFVQIKEPMEPHIFYIMLYNNGSEEARNRITISY